MSCDLEKKLLSFGHDLGYPCTNVYCLHGYNVLAVKVVRRTLLQFDRIFFTKKVMAKLFKLFICILGALLMPLLPFL